MKTKVNITKKNLILILDTKEDKEIQNIFYLTLVWIFQISLSKMQYYKLSKISLRLKQSNYNHNMEKQYKYSNATHMFNIFFLSLAMIKGILLSLLLIQIYPQQQQQLDAQPKLIFVEEIFRHGARYPEKVIGIHDQYAVDQKSQGELTNQGRSMHYILGKKMYQLYWKRLFGGTPNQHIVNKSKFYVKSTDVNRTLESVQSHLYGLLEALPSQEINNEDLAFSVPPFQGIQAKAGSIYSAKGKKYHTMPIHVEFRQNSIPSQNFLATFSSNNCPRQPIWHHNNYQSKQAQKLFNTPIYIQAMRQLSLSLGLNQTMINYNNFYHYYDGLICMKFMGKKVPQILLKPSQYKRALEAFYSLQSIIAFNFNQHQIQVSSSGFFGDAINRIISIINSSQGVQWVIYSAHDLTITQILAAMGMWNANCLHEAFLKNISDTQSCINSYPTYSSIIILEVYQYNNDTYTFKFNYNGQYRKIPFCEYREECLVTKLEEWYQSWAVQDTADACSINSYSKQYKLEWIWVGMLLYIIIMLLRSMMLNILQIKHTQTFIEDTQKIG